MQAAKNKFLQNIEGVTMFNKDCIMQFENLSTLSCFFFGSKDLGLDDFGHVSRTLI